jgi:hypothetical protein
MLQVKALLHAADISNHVRPFQIALAHAERVQQEFRRQVACERALGLPVSPHMDAPEQTWCKMEVQFIDYVAGPLWERLGQVSSNQPGPACEIFVAVACTKLAQSAKRLLVRVAITTTSCNNMLCCALLAQGATVSVVHFVWCADVPHLAGAAAEHANQPRQVCCNGAKLDGRGRLGNPS